MAPQWPRLGHPPWHSLPNQLVIGKMLRVAATLLLSGESTTLFARIGALTNDIQDDVVQIGARRCGCAR